MAHPSAPCPAPGRRCRGAALATALVLLLVLTVLGVSVLNTVMLEERMAGNLRDSTLAFETAETVLMSAERNLAGGWRLGVDPKPDCSNQVCDAVNGTPTYDGVNPLDFENNAHNDGFWYANSVTYTGAINNAAKNPSYYVEKTDNICSTAEINCEGGSIRGYYRVTARGIGAGTNTVSILQIHFARTEDFYK